jgi:hypothetical protein
MTIARGEWIRSRGVPVLIVEVYMLQRGLKAP